MNTHKRQGSTGSNGFKQTNNDTNHLEESFYSLDYFMNVTKQMEDEIMVPSKLKDKLFDKMPDEEVFNENPLVPDALDHYRFLVLIRNQFLKSDSFQNIDELNSKILEKKNFKTIFNNLSFHYCQLMSTLDTLSKEAKAITEIYKENV